MNRTVQRKLRLMLAVLASCLCTILYGSALTIQPEAMGVTAIVKVDGTAVTTGILYAYCGSELRGVASYDSTDGVFYLNVGASATTESFTFTYWISESAFSCDEILAFNALGYGTVGDDGLVPQILTVNRPRTISTAVSPANSGTVTGGDTYPYGSTVALTATPATGYELSEWLKDGVGMGTTTNPLSITVTADATYTAVFTKIQCPVSATVSPAGSGTVAGAGTVDYGGSATLTATPATGYEFVNWTKDGTAVGTSATLNLTDVTASAAYVANFTKKQCTVMVEASPATGGRVIGDGTYDYGTKATLTAVADDGYVFMKWLKDGVDAGTANPLTTAALSAASVTYTAVFTDNTAVPVISITVADDLASEPGGNYGTGQFVIYRKTADGANFTGGTTTVNLQIGGTATNGVDYTTLGSTVKFSGTGYKSTKTVSPKADSIVDDNETVVITILPGTGYVVGSPSTGTVTIRDASVTAKPLAVPMTVKATVAADGLKVTWRAVTDATHYRVQRTERGAAEAIMVSDWVSGTSFTDTTAVPGVIYTYRVCAASDASGTNAGKWSAGALGSLPLSAPKDVTASQDNPAGIVLAWTADGTYSTVRRGSGRSAVVIASGLTEQTYTDTTAVPGTSYTYTVTTSMYLDTGDSPASAAVKGLCPATPVAASAAPLLLTRGNDTALTRGISTQSVDGVTAVTVTFTVAGPEAVASLFAGDVIPDGWTVTSAGSGLVADGAIRFAFEQPDIPASFSYTITAADAAAGTLDSVADGNGIYFLSGDFVPYAFSAELTQSVAAAAVAAAIENVAFEEWPLEAAYYAVSEGIEGLVFSWPAIAGADGYVLTAYDADGAVVAAKSVAGTSATLTDLPYSAVRWNVMAGGLESPLTALPQAGGFVITGGVAADDAVILSVSGAGGILSCDVLFYAADGSQTSSAARLLVVDGAARLELGQPAAGGYLCIRPAGSSVYTELFLE